MEQCYYVYRYYFKSTNITFYIGKGKNNRYKDIIHSRNDYFKNTIKLYKDDVQVDLLYENLDNDTACKLEKELISNYWKKGECKCNFHEGGCGGNTGKYDSKERSQKLSNAAKSRVGNKNSMYGKHHSEETKQKLRNANLGKTISHEHIEKLRAANLGRPKTKEEIEKIRKANLGKKLSQETYDKMMKAVCIYKYQAYLNNELIFECLGHTKFYKLCKMHFNISRSIADKIINNTWVPKFKKYDNIKTLKIIRIHNSVSTNRDECNGVGRSLEPLEVHSNLN